MNFKPHHSCGISSKGIGILCTWPSFWGELLNKSSVSLSEFWRICSLLAPALKRPYHGIGLVKGNLSNCKNPELEIPISFWFFFIFYFWVRNLFAQRGSSFHPTLHSHVEQVSITAFALGQIISLPANGDVCSLTNAIHSTVLNVLQPTIGSYAQH